MSKKICKTNIMKKKTILDYFLGLGVSLDQTQAALREKSASPNVIRKYYFNQMIKGLGYTEKYGITLTFRPSFHKDDPLFLHRLVQKKIYASRLWKHMKYVLYSEYTASGILHYHGYLYGCYQTHVTRIDQWWKRNFGTITKVEYKLRYAYCGDDLICTQKNKSKAKHCWLHYVSKDADITGLWILSNL